MIPVEGTVSRLMSLTRDQNTAIEEQHLALDRRLRALINRGVSPVAGPMPFSNGSG